MATAAFFDLDRTLIRRSSALALAGSFRRHGVIGLLCETDDGVYTGRAVRTCHGAGKAEAVRELAVQHAIDLARSTAYSDSASDLPLLETVGSPVAVNPDRALRRVADERGWPVRAFGGGRAA